MLLHYLGKDKHENLMFCQKRCITACVPVKTKNLISLTALANVVDWFHNSVTNRFQRKICTCMLYFRLTLSMLLHYLVKVENYSCHQFTISISSWVYDLIIYLIRYGHLEGRTLPPRQKCPRTKAPHDGDGSMYVCMYHAISLTSYK